MKAPEYEIAKVALLASGLCRQVVTVGRSYYSQHTLETSNTYLLHHFCKCVKSCNLLFFVQH